MEVFWALSSPTIFFTPLLLPSYYSSVVHFYPILLSHAILLCYSPMLSNPILSELPLFLLISTLLYPIFITPLLYSIFSSPLLSSSLISSPIFISSLLSSPSPGLDIPENTHSPAAWSSDGSDDLNSLTSTMILLFDKILDVLFVPFFWLCEHFVKERNSVTYCIRI